MGVYDRAWGDNTATTRVTGAVVPRRHGRHDSITPGPTFNAGRAGRRPTMEGRKSSAAEWEVSEGGGRTSCERPSTVYMLGSFRCDSGRAVLTAARLDATHGSWGLVCSNSATAK